MKNNDRVRFTFRLPSDLFEKVNQMAFNQGVSKNALILQILWDYMQSKEGLYESCSKRNRQCSF